MSGTQTSIADANPALYALKAVMNGVRQLKDRGVGAERPFTSA